MEKLKIILRKYKIIKISIIAFIIYFLFSFIKIEMQISEKKESLLSVQEDIKTIQSNNDKLSEILSSGEEFGYIERVAREKLGFLYPDERVFINIFGN